MSTDTIVHESDFAARLAAKAARDAEAEANSQVAQFEPLADRVLVQRASVPEEVTTKGGILVPLQAREKPLEATVIAVGPGRRLDSGALIPVFVSPWDTILIGKYSGTEVNLDDREFLILNESEIFGVIRRRT